MEVRNIINEKHADLFNNILKNDVTEEEKCQQLEALVSKDKSGDVANSLGFYYEGLHYAAKNSFVQIAKLFLKYNVNVNATDEYNYSALHYAVLSESKNANKIVILLCYHNVDVNIFTTAGETALHIATRMGKVRCAEMLLTWDPACRDLKNKNGFTAEEMIFEIERITTRIIMVQVFANTLVLNKLQLTPLHMAVINQNFEQVKSHLDLGAFSHPVNIYGYNALLLAAEGGDPNIMKLLCIQPGIDMNILDKIGENALHKAVKNNHPKCAKVLVTSENKIHKHVPNHKNQTPEKLVQYLEEGEDRKIMMSALKASPVISDADKYEIRQMNLTNKEKISEVQSRFKSLDLVTPFIKSDGMLVQEDTIRTKSRSKSVITKNPNKHQKNALTTTTICENFTVKDLPHFVNTIRSENNPTVISNEMKMIGNIIHNNPDRNEDIDFLMEALKLIKKDVLDGRKEFEMDIKYYERDLYPKTMNVLNFVKQDSNTESSNSKNIPADIVVNSDDPQKNQIAKYIIKICHQKKIAGNNLRLQTIGLLSCHSIEKILSVINEIFPQLQDMPRMISSLIVKELILLAENFNHEIAKDEIKILFVEYLKNLADEDTKSLLKNNLADEDTKNLLKNIYEAISTQKSNIAHFKFLQLRDTILLRSSSSYKIKMKLENLDDSRFAVEMANELTQMATKIFQLFSLNKSHNDMSEDNPVFLLIKSNNALECLIKNLIFSQPTKKLRTKMIAFWIQTGKACLSREIPNVNHAWVIGCALQSFVIERLTDSFDMLSQKCKKNLDELKKLVEEKHLEYRNLQEAYKIIFPYLSIHEKDEDYIKKVYSSAPLQFLNSMGTLYNHLLLLKNQIELNIPYTKSDIFSYLLSYEIIPDEKFEAMSYKVKPRIIDLSISSTIGDHENALNVIRKYNHPLYVYYKGGNLYEKEKLYEGTKALKFITDFFQHLYKKNAIKDPETRIRMDKFLEDCNEYLIIYNQTNINHDHSGHHLLLFKRRTSSSKPLTIIDKSETSQISLSPRENSTTQEASECLISSTFSYQSQ